LFYVNDHQFHPLPLLLKQVQKKTKDFLVYLLNYFSSYSTIGCYSCFTTIRYHRTFTSSSR
jgi:hypothetical protein